MSRALRAFGCGSFAAGGAWLAACGVVLPVEEDRPPVHARNDASASSSDGGDASENGDADSASDAFVVVERERVVFVTKGTFPGTFGGVPGADALCQDAANKSDKLVGKLFQAWISTKADEVVVRLPHGEKAYRRVDDKVIASNWNDLTDGTLTVPIDLDENGGQATGFAWTGTNLDGVGLGGCDDWQSAKEQSRYGQVAKTDGLWTNGAQAFACSTLLHLYCFER